jgi:hypothetical protein
VKVTEDLFEVKRVGLFLVRESENCMILKVRGR